MVYRRCKCTGTNCPHWNINYFPGRGLGRERGPVSKYAFLLAPGQLLPVTKTEAKELENRVRLWVLDRRPPVQRPGSVESTPASTTTIATAGKHYLTTFVRKELDGNGEVGIVERIIATCGSKPLAALLDRAVVRSYLQDVAEHSGQTSSNRHYSRWSHLSNWCRVEYDLKGDSPFYHRQLRPQGLQKYPEGSRHRRLTEDEDAALIRVLTAYAKVDGGMMLGRYYCALDACLRRGEMLQLKTQGGIIRGKDGSLALRLHWKTTKGRKTRDVEVETKRLRAFLDARRFAPYPFGAHDGSYVAGFRVDWEAALWAAQLVTGPRRRQLKEWQWAGEPLTWHDLRHEGASRLLEAGVNVRVIQTILGHSSLGTTERYLNLHAKSTRDGMRQAALAMGL